MGLFRQLKGPGAFKAPVGLCLIRAAGSWWIGVCLCTGKGMWTGLGWVPPRQHSDSAIRASGRRGVACNRSIPGWAEETLDAGAGVDEVWVYPRVGGGNPLQRLRLRLPVGLSPGGRRKHESRGIAAIRRRSIPGWAEETSLETPKISRCAVYPRVGGGNAWVFDTDYLLNSGGCQGS